MQAAALDAAEALARDHARGSDAGEYARVLYAALERMPGEGDRLAPLLAELAARGSEGGGGEGEGFFFEDAFDPLDPLRPSSSAVRRGLLGPLWRLRRDGRGRGFL